MPPKNSPNKKIYILLGLVILVVIISIASILMGSGNNSSSSSSGSKTYTLQTNILSYSLPLDFEPTSSGPESATISYTGSNKSLISSSIVISRYLKKDSSNEDSIKLKELLSKDISGTEISDLSIAVSKTKSSRPILIAKSKSNPTKSTYYLINDQYIWKIDVSVGDEKDLKKIQTIANSIAESITEK